MASDTNLGGKQFAFPEVHRSVLPAQPDASPVVANCGQPATRSP